jgi:glycogen(starch) synthase
MRIANVTPYFHPVYYASHEACLSRELVRRGHEVTILTTNRMPRWGGAKGLGHERLPLGTSTWEGVRIVRMRPGPTVSFVPWMPGLRRELLASDCDVIMSHEVFSMASSHAAAVARARGIPLFLVQHGYQGGRRLAFRCLFQLQFQMFGRRVLQTASRAVSLTRLGRDFLTGLGAEAEKVYVIPTGVDCEQFARPGAQRRAGTAFGFLGRVEMDKGIFTLLEALAGLPPALGATLTCIGEGDGLISARRFAAERGLPVQFLGRQEHSRLPHLLQQLDVLCIPTLHAEPFGIVAVEAAAAGLPVIASRLGGLAETVREGETGCLVTPGDVPQLRGCMAALATDPAFCEQLGKGARRLAEASYSWPAIGKAFESLMHAAVATAGSR